MKQEVICHSPILATPGLEGSISAAIIVRLEVKDGKTIIHLGSHCDYYVAHAGEDQMCLVQRISSEKDKHPFWPFHSGCTEPRQIEEIKRVQEACK